LKRHLREQHSNEITSAKCENCGRPIRPRAFKDHLKSRNCRKNTDSNSLVSKNRGVRASTPNLGPQLRPSSVWDPLIIGASLWRAGAEDWLAAGRPLGLLNGRHRFDIASGHEVAVKEPKLPSSSLVGIWKLRGLILAQTIEMVKVRGGTMSTRETFSHGAP
jgi:hypothetical protein